MKAKMQLQQQFKQLTFLLSDESLQLLPEYQQRVQVSNVSLTITVQNLTSASENVTFIVLTHPIQWTIANLVSAD